MKNHNWIPVGYVAGVHGLKGQLKCSFFNPDPEWLKPGVDFYLAPKDGNEPIRASSEDKKSNHSSSFGYKVIRLIILHSNVQNQYLLTFQDVSSREKAEEFKSCQLMIPADSLKTENEDELYFNQIIGCEFYDATKSTTTSFGVIEGVSHTSAHDIVVVKSHKDELYFEVPWVKSFIERIDLDKKQVLFNVPEGLFDEELGQKTR